MARPAETYRCNIRRALSLAQKAAQPKDRKERRRKRREKRDEELRPKASA